MLKFNPITSELDLVGSSTGTGSGVVETIVAGNNIDVDSTDPANPIVSVETLTLADISDVTATVTELNYVAGVTSAIQTQLDGKQPLDGDLTAIAGLSASNDDFIQRKSGAWANRTIAQVKSDLSLSGSNTGDQTITLTGDVTGSGTGSFATTLASTAVTPTSYTLTNLTVDAKGRITAASNGTVTLTSQVTGTLPIANGGTGSATQNFVDLTTTQNVGGAKTLTDTLTSRTVAPSANLTYDLGSSSNYFTNTYARTINLNSTASLGGSNAGIVSLTGRFTGTNTVDHPGTGDLGPFDLAFTNTASYASGEYRNSLKVTSNHATTNWLTALKLNPVYSGSGTATLVRGMWLPVENTSTGTVTSAVGFAVQLYPTNATGTTTSWTGMSVDAPGSPASGHTISNMTGLSVAAQTGTITPATFTGISVSAQTSSSTMNGISISTPTSTGGAARGINLGGVTVSGGSSDAIGVNVGNVANSGSGVAYAIFTNAGIVRLGGEMIMASSTGIRANSTADLLRLSGGTANDGGVIILGGSTHGSVASRGILRVGGTDVVTWTSTALTFADAKNIVFNATTGTKIGTATTEKIGFWNATPVVRPTLTTDFSYTITNDATDRTIDANATTLDELADFAATVAKDLQDFKNKIKTTGLIA